MNIKSEPIRSIADLQSHLKNPLNRCLLPLDITIPKPGPKVLLCHDMAGGYKQDSYIQGTKTASKVYNCQYWQYVDIFCYFSHERIAIPPVVWTNACHRNQVACLGTIIVEGRDGIEECLRLIYGPGYNFGLPSTQLDYSPVYADALIELAGYYGFDGYLVNIESPLPSSSHCIVLQNFLRYFTNRMKENLSHGLVIWYDSVIYTGQLRWQDQLNAKNEMFFDVCDAIFTNYTWNEKILQESAVNAKDRKLQVYTGIDVWGRRTFGGGGFNLHKALKEIKAACTSVAIFAPAWTFERLGVDTFEIAESRFWFDKDVKLPFSASEISSFELKLDENDLGCAGDILQPKFIEHLFYCCFDQGFGNSFSIDGKIVSTQSWQHLSTQSISPSYRKFLVQGGHFDESGIFVGDTINSDYAKLKSKLLAFHGGYSLYVYTSSGKSPTSYYISLFRTKIVLDDHPYFLIEIVIQRKHLARVGISYNDITTGIVKMITAFKACSLLENGWEKLTFDPKSISSTELLGDLGIWTESDVILGSFALVPLLAGTIVQTSVHPISKYPGLLITWNEPQGIALDSRHVFVDDHYVGTSFTNHYLLDSSFEAHKVQIVGKDRWQRTTLQN